MIGLIPAAPLPAARIDVALIGLGFTRVADFPFERGIREVHYRLAEARLELVVGGQEGASLLKIEEVPAPVVERIERALEASPPEALIAALRAAKDARAAVRALARLSVVFYAEGLPVYDEALGAVLARLTDPDRVVRWTAYRVAPGFSRKVEAALEAAKDRFPELRAPWEEVRDFCQRKEEGTLADAPTREVDELERRAEEGAAQKQWKRVLAATDTWLEERPDAERAQHLRALAHQGLGQPLLALAWMASAVASVQIKHEVAVQLDEEHPEREPEAPGRKEQLDRWTAERDAIRAEAVALPEADRSAGGLDEILDRAAKAEAAYRPTGVHGSVAEALAGMVPGMEPLFRWLRLSRSADRREEDWAALLREAPDSPWVWNLRARTLDDPAESDKAWDEALRLLAAGGTSVDDGGLSPPKPPGPVAARIAALQALAGKSLTEEEILESRMNGAYERKDWDEAAARADALVARSPGSVSGWQIRANARCFALRHEEAAAAYDDALRALTRVIDEDEKSYLTDPRIAMHFNRACVLAKLGRREEALEGLRHAVRGDEKYAKDAAEDDYFEALWGDPELQGIVRGDVEARLLAEEKTPGHALALIQAANAAIAGMDAARAATLSGRALLIAKLLGQPALHIAAGMVAGYVTVAKGDVEGGLALARAARSELDAFSDAPADFRAEQLAEYVTALSTANLLDEAEVAAREAREARVAAFGEVSLQVVLSENQLLLIQTVRAAPVPERLATLDRASALVEALIARSPEEGEAHAQRGIFLVRRAELTEDAGSRLALVEGSADALEKAAALGGLRAQSVDIAMVALEHTPASTDLWARSDAVHKRLAALLFPDPDERAERLFWRRIRMEIRLLRRAGLADDAIAGALADLLRGNTPELVERYGVFSGFAERMAHAMADIPTLSVLAMMAIQTATLNGDVLGAIDQLEGMLVGGGDGDYEDEGDEDEDEGDDEDEGGDE